MKSATPRLHWLRPPGPVAAGLTIGLLGGSFNPAHEGHLHISNLAIKKLGLDYVWWLVSPQNPLKPSIGMAPLAERLAYAAAMFENDRRVFVMDIEREIGTRYTIDTLKKLKRRFPQVRFVWLMGTDNLASFRRWKRWEEIANEVPIAIVVRPGSTLAPLHAKAAQRFGAYRREAAALRRASTARPPWLTVLDGPRNPLSATQLREKTGWAEALVRAIPAC
jgi:nicotinate-nucleotide adenylyltransferase